MIINVEMFNSHIRETKAFTLSATKLEERLQQFQYDGEHLQKDTAVEDTKLPPFALVLYGYLFAYDDFPSPDGFIDEYFNQEYFEYLPDGKVQVTFNNKSAIYSLDGIIARILRAYPSFVRDFHFYLLAKESGLFENVRYSFADDYYKKTDIQVQYKGNWYAVGLMLASKRSFFYKVKKQFRHKPGKVIYIELEPEQSKQCGNFYLYTDGHIQELHRIVAKQKRHR